MVGPEANFSSEFKSADTGPANFRTGRVREPVVALNYSRSFASACSFDEPGSFSTPSAGGRLYKKSCEAVQSKLAPQKRLYKRFSRAWRQRTANATKPQAKDKAGDDSDLDSSGCSIYSATADDTDSCLSSSTLRESVCQDGDEPGLSPICLGSKCRSESSLSCPNAWQPPSSDLYNAPIADGAEDMETLRRWAQRHRITAAKLLPKMNRRQRDSGIAMHERTLSKDSGSSQSPKAATRLLKSPPVSYSESSSIATDLSSSGSFVGSGSGAGADGMVEVCTTAFLETDLLEDGDPAGSSAVNHSDGCHPEVSGQEPIAQRLVDLCSPADGSSAVEDDDGYCSIQVDSLARPDKMSSSNLVYAVPVKPSYDSPRAAPSQDLRCASPLSAWPRAEANSKDFEVVHLAPPSRNDGSELNGFNGLCYQYDSVPSPLPSVEPNRLTPVDHRLAQSSPQSVPKRTVVPVYPFQAHAPTVEPVLTDLKACGKEPAEPLPREQGKVALAEGEVARLVDVPVEWTERAIQAHSTDTASEDCLGKSLDAVLTNLVNNIMAGAHSFGEKATSCAVPKDQDGSTAGLASFCVAADEKVTTSSCDDLEKEKLDLIARLARKLKVLKEEKREIEEEIKANEAIGNDLLCYVENSQASAAVKQKLRTYAQDVERITKLFLKLSAQLKRIVRQLNRAGDGHPAELRTLRDRRSLLLSQLEDARELKEGIYGRGVQLARLLPEVLAPEQMIDYQYFVQMKSKLLVEAQEIDDKIAHGEEQKEFLERS
uniref:ASD2 domain-containing protein n=1 Tax=Trichuris muris TaxID=70415 RepID=A0A5S6QT09_TRIMR